MATVSQGEQVLPDAGQYASDCSTPWALKVELAIYLHVPLAESRRAPFNTLEELVRAVDLRRPVRRAEANPVQRRRDGIPL
jgi:hypothetical protein